MHTDGEPCLSSEGAPAQRKPQAAAHHCFCLSFCTAVLCFTVWGGSVYSLRLPAPSGLGAVPL